MKKYTFDGDFLRELRKRNDMTLQEVADEIGTSKGYVYGLRLNALRSLVFRKSLLFLNLWVSI